MDELMTKGIGHTEFREDPDVGMVPKKWDVVRLISVLSEKTKYGYSGMQVQSGSKVRVLTLSAVTNNEISEKNSKECSHDPALIHEYWVKKDDIFIGRSNTRDLVGLTAIYRGTKPFAIFADLLIRVRADKTKITPDFLSYYLVSDYVRTYFAASSKGTSGSMKKIDTSIIEELKVSLPPLSEQQRITSILSTIDRKLTLQRKRIAHYEKLKQGLMNELLTGKRRVKVT
jgi:type I restriction enzyme S subunit